MFWEGQYPQSESDAGIEWKWVGETRQDKKVSEPVSVCGEQKGELNLVNQRRP